MTTATANKNQKPKNLRVKLRSDSSGAALYRFDGNSWSQYGYGNIHTLLQLGSTQPGDGVTSADKETGAFLPPEDTDWKEVVGDGNGGLTTKDHKATLCPTQVVAQYKDLPADDVLKLAREVAEKFGLKETVRRNGSAAFEMTST